MMGPAVGYIDRLDEKTLLKIDEEIEASKAKSPLRPSAAGSCTRALAFQMMMHLGKADYPSDNRAPSVHRLLNLGSSIEAHLIDQLKLILPDYVVAHQQEKVSLGVVTSTVDPNFSQEIVGSIDLILWSQEHKCLVDIKSKKDWPSPKRFKTHWTATSEKLAGMPMVSALSKQSFWVKDLVAFLAELKDPFFEANFLQLNMYAQSEFLRDKGVNHCAVIQYNKNTSELREVRFAPSPELFHKCIKKFQTAMDAGIQGSPELAPRDYERGSIACRYCRFSSPCKKIPDLTGQGEQKEGSK